MGNLFCEFVLVVLDAHSMQKEMGGECCGMGRRQGLSLRVKRDERVGGLVVGWGGCECDGLVSNTLSFSMSAHKPIPRV